MHTLTTMRVLRAKPLANNHCHFFFECDYPQHPRNSFESGEPEVQTYNSIYTHIAPFPYIHLSSSHFQNARLEISCQARFKFRLIYNRIGIAERANNGH